MMQKHYIFLNLIILGAIAFTITSCGGNVRKQLGLNKDAPDEFRVIKHAPLEMPKGTALPPPTPGVARPQEYTPTQSAEKAMFGAVNTNTQTVESKAESSLLQKAGATDIDPSIRETINEETVELNERNKPVMKKLMDIGKDETTPPASVVDAKAEYERIKKNKEEGKPLTEGETPSIQE